MKPVSAGLVRTYAPAEAVSSTRRSRVLLVPWMVAGVQAQFEQIRRATDLEGARIIEVHPHRSKGLIEHLPLPSSLRGTIRSTMAAVASIPMRGIDAVWTQVALPMLPFALSRGGGRTPIYYAIDCTPALLRGFGGQYAGVDDPRSPQGRLTRGLLRLFFRRCAGLLPWSEWAARSMIEDYGARTESVHVVPPGIDLDYWHPDAGRRSVRPRVLFVGSDFERKGGPLLLDTFRRYLRDECDLHLVTRRSIAPEPGVHVYTDMKIGDARLRDLYQSCDMLVIPTLADCFSMAALEAMACGLPVVISEVGGIPEIVIEGETGFLIAPGQGQSLLAALRVLLASPAQRRTLGGNGRRRAEQLFNGRVQSEKTLAIMGASTRQ